MLVRKITSVLILHNRILIMRYAIIKCVNHSSADLEVQLMQINHCDGV